MRLNYNQLEGIKEKFGVDRIWSYSRISSFVQHPWEYRMTYLEKVGRGQNVYGYLGNVCHDIIQDAYEGKHKFKEMPDLFDEAIMDWRLNYPELKFMNKNVEDGYIKNVRDYFENTEIIPYEIVNEKSVCIHIHDEKRDEDIVLVGYIDSEYTDDDGYFNILDYKTSSRSGFSGKQLKEKSQQLGLYAIGVSQFRGIPLEKIRLRFDMMKYYEIRFMQKNGKLGKTIQERSKWVQGVHKRVNRKLAELEYDPLEVDDMMEIAIMNNNLDNLPKEVQDMFTLHNYYIDVQITEEEAEELKQFVCDTVADIREREKGDWEKEFPEPVIDRSNSFYFEQLAPHLLKHHKSYQAQMEMQKGIASEEDLLSLFQ